LSTRLKLKLKLKQQAKNTGMHTCVYMQGAVATLITMPLDVMKTRMMNAPPGTYSVKS